jgi:hypothetical protein
MHAATERRRHRLFAHPAKNRDSSTPFVASKCAQRMVVFWIVISASFDYNTDIYIYIYKYIFVAILLTPRHAL